MVPFLPLLSCDSPVSLKENLDRKKKYDDLETLVIEIDNTKNKIVIVNLVYSPPNGSIKTVHEYLKLLLDRTTVSNKDIILIGDFNVNLLDFYYSHIVKNYVKKLFKSNLLLWSTNLHVLTVNLFLQLTK